MTVSSPMTLLVRIARPLLLVATMAPWGLAAMGDTADELDGSQLVKFAEFCAETDGVEPEGRGALAGAHGFAPVESIADRIEAFFDLRDRAFAHRGEVNKAMGESVEAALRGIGEPHVTLVTGPDDWTAIIAGPTPAAIMNGEEVGRVHGCRFYGYGWISEAKAEEALAAMVGEDFLGRGRTLPGLDWSYLFTGTQRGPVPKRVILVSATKGVADDVPPTIIFEFGVIHDMTIPESVVSRE